MKKKQNCDRYTIILDIFSQHLSSNFFAPGQVKVVRKCAQNEEKMLRCAKMQGKLYYRVTMMFTGIQI